MLKKLYISVSITIIASCSEQRLWFRLEIIKVLCAIFSCHISQGNDHDSCSIGILEVIKLIFFAVKGINKKTIWVDLCFRSLIFSEDASDSGIELFPKIILRHIESSIDEDIGPVYFSVVFVYFSLIKNYFIGFLDNFYFLWSASSNWFYSIVGITTRFKGLTVRVSNNLLRWEPIHLWYRRNNFFEHIQMLVEIIMRTLSRFQLNKKLSNQT